MKFAGFGFGKSLSVSLFVLLAAASGFGIASVDPSYAPVASKPIALDSIAGQLVASDGKIIIWGGDLAVDGRFGQIQRLNSDGSVDSTFVNCGCLASGVTSVKMQSDGKFLVAGTDSTGRAKVVRLSSDGSLDPSYNNTFAGFTFAASVAELHAVESDDKAYASISGQVSGGFHAGYLVRLNTDGSVDPTFTQIGYDGGQLIHGAIGAFELDGGGDFFMAIVTSSGIGSSVTLKKYTSTGSVSSSFEAPTISGGLSSSVGSISRQTDGAIVIAGTFSTVNGVARNGYARILPAGNVDLGFEVTGVGPVGGYTKVLPGGKILTTNTSALVRLNSTGAVDNTFSHPASIIEITNKFALDGTGGIMVAGRYGTNLYRFYRLDADGPIDSAFNPNITVRAEVYAQVLQSDGKLVISGTFTQLNGVAKPTIGRLNTDGTLDTSFDPGTGFSSAPTSLAIQSDGKVLAAGSFSTFNGVSQGGVARLNSNGSLDGAFAPVVSSVKGVSLQSDGRILIFGGFTTVNGNAALRLARLLDTGAIDGTFTATISSGTVYSAIQLGDGKIVAGGSFTGVDGFNRSNLVRLESTGTLDQAFTATGISSVDKITIQPDGKFICTLGAGSPAAIARRNTDGSPDSGFTPPTFTSDNSSDLRIYSVVIQTDGSLIVGGNFNYLGTTRRNHIARLSSSGALDLLFLPSGASRQLRTLIRETSGNVIAGGDFATLSGYSRAALARITPGAFTRVVPYDFDGDGRSDIAVFRASENKWYILRSSDSQVDQPIFGIAGDKPVPADFDGDGKTDLAIFRPSSGDWWSLSSASGQQIFAHLGAAGDVPLPSDISGDGRADYVVYRPSNFIWYRTVSSNGQFTQIQFGAAADKPVIGDVDGDGKFEPVIYRPSTGDWWWQSSVDNVQRATHWGISTDIPCPGDYDGDGKTDFAVYRPSEGIWYIRYAVDGSYFITKFGIAEDKPVPADYDGDGKADIAVYRPSTGVWYLLKSTEGFAALQFGISTDVPIANAFVP